MKHCHLLQLFCLAGSLVACKSATPKSELRDDQPELKSLFSLPAVKGVNNFRTNKGSIVGDPINVALIGDAKLLDQALSAINWAPADPITIRSSLGIAYSTASGSRYPTAPISTLNYLNRPQDKAYEQQIRGNSAQRHHARFWQTEVTWKSGDKAGSPIWVAAATFDQSAGISTTGVWHPTHHIDPKIDKERDFLVDALIQKNAVDQQTFTVPGAAVSTAQFNAEGDPFVTDGNIRVIVLQTPPSPEQMFLTDPLESAAATASEPKDLAPGLGEQSLTEEASNSLIDACMNLLQNLKDSGTSSPSPDSCDSLVNDVTLPTGDNAN